MQEALTDTLKDLLPTDTKVNEEAAKMLVDRRAKPQRGGAEQSQA